MKRRIAGLVVVLGLIVCLAGFKTNARTEEDFVTPHQIRCTCYTDTGATASGAHTRKGTAAGRKEWLGKVAILRKVNPDGSMGEFIGYYEFLDTGAGIDTTGDGIGNTLKDGESIDIWVENSQEVQQWIKSNGDYVYMQIVDGKG